MNVLFVDDDVIALEMLSDIAESAGYSTSRATGGALAIQLLTYHNIHLIITDWNMPEMDGVTLTQHIRKMNKYKTIPIIMLTANGEKEHIVKALSSGVNDYILKPINAATVKEKLNKWCTQ